MIMDTYSYNAYNLKNNKLFEEKVKNSDKFFQVMLFENESNRLDETFNGYIAL